MLFCYEETSRLGFSLVLCFYDRGKLYSSNNFHGKIAAKSYRIIWNKFINYRAIVHLLFSQIPIRKQILVKIFRKLRGTGKVVRYIETFKWRATILRNSIIALIEANFAKKRSYRHTKYHWKLFNSIVRIQSEARKLLKFDIMLTLTLLIIVKQFPRLSRIFFHNLSSLFSFQKLWLRVFLTCPISLSSQ